MVNKKIILSSIIGMSLALSCQAMTTYGPTKSGDNVWKVAKQFHLAGVSLPQMIEAIQQLNPNAFSGPNQTMRAGVILKIPTRVSEVDNTATASTSTPPNPAPTPAVNNSPTASTPSLTVSQAEQQIADLQQQLTEAQANEGSSGWAWLWFLLFVGVSGASLYQRKWLPPLIKRNHHQASERAGTNRSEHAPQEISRHKTLGLTKNAMVSGEGTLIADVMIDVAEQRFDEAEKKLLSAIRENKHNLDLRIKLLELYVTTNNQTAFNRHAEYILKNLVSENDELWAKIREMYLKKWVYDA